MFFAPSGTLHAIRNVGADPAEFILAFSHELPEDFGLRAAFGAMTPAVLGNTFDAPADKTRRPECRNPRSRPPLDPRPAPPQAIEPQARHTSPLKFRIEAALPEIASPAGRRSRASRRSGRRSRTSRCPRCAITDRGMREPHWHPETQRWATFCEGRARMTILDRRQRRHLRYWTGDVYFIPRAYPHHIEDIGAGTFHILIFFDRATPGDIGFRTLVGAFPRDLLAATFGLAEPDLPALPLRRRRPVARRTASTRSIRTRLTGRKTT